MPKVIVFGSMNMDLSIDAPRVPAAGETLTGSGFITAAGGKGANQAVAASRLGADVRMIAVVGADGFGDELTAGLAAAGVDVSLVRHVADETTGVAVILRTAGENRIVLHAGANHALDAGDVVSDLRRIGEKNDILVTQGECDPAATEAALREAHDLGLYTVFNPAPARPVPDDLWPCVDLVCLNETECQTMCGVLPSDDEACLVCASWVPVPSRSRSGRPGRSASTRTAPFASPRPRRSSWTPRAPGTRSSARLRPGGHGPSRLPSPWTGAPGLRPSP